MTAAAPSLPTTDEPAAPTAPTAAPRAPQALRMTDEHPDYLRLRAATLKRLQASVATLVRDLKAASRGQGRAVGTVPEAQTAFIARHTALLRDAYLQAHHEGQRHYWEQTSATPATWATATAQASQPTARQVQQRLLFYAAGSVTKLASQAAQALHDGQLRAQQQQPARRAATLTALTEPRPDDDVALNYPDPSQGGHWHSNGGGGASSAHEDGGIHGPHGIAEHESHAQGGKGSVKAKNPAKNPAKSTPKTASPKVSSALAAVAKGKAEADGKIAKPSATKTKAAGAKVIKAPTHLTPEEQALHDQGFTHPKSAYGGMHIKVEQHAGKTTVDVRHVAEPGKAHVVTIEADHTLGGYKLTAGDHVSHGYSLASVNAHLSGMTGVGKLLSKTDVAEPGPKLTGAAKKAAEAQIAYNKMVPEHGNTAEEYQIGSGAPAVIYHLKNGDMVTVGLHTIPGSANNWHGKGAVYDHYTISHTPATLDMTGKPYDPHGYTWDAKGTYKAKQDYDAKTSTSAKTHEEVQAYLQQHNVTNEFTAHTISDHLAKMEAKYPNWGNHAAEAHVATAQEVAKAQKAAAKEQKAHAAAAHLAQTGGDAPAVSGTDLPAGVSPHSTTGFNATLAYNTSHGLLADAGPANGGVGHYDIRIGQQVIHISADAHGVNIDYPKALAKDQNAHAKGMTPEAAKADLEAHGITSGDAKIFADMAHHDYQQYVAPPTTDQAARIAATTARKAELTAKFGTYTEAKARDLVQQTYAKYQGLRQAVQSHLGGAGHLEASQIATKMYGGGKKSATSEDIKAAKTAAAKEALGRLHEITEWSLLHSENVTREGTIRLFHGTNGKSGPDVWKTRMKSGDERRGTPFTDRWAVGRSFADSGKHGRLLISAHVPVSAISIWHGIRSDSMYQHEHEYTVGTGKIGDYAILNLNKL